MSFVVRKLSGERAMVEPTSQPPGFKCWIVFRRNWEGEFMCSRTSKSVIISAADSEAFSGARERRARSSTAQFRERSFGSDNAGSERWLAFATATTEDVGSCYDRLCGPQTGCGGCEDATAAPDVEVAVFHPWPCRVRRGLQAGAYEVVAERVHQVEETGGAMRIPP
jgi:hypothetical protein